MYFLPVQNLASEGHRITLVERKQEKGRQEWDVDLWRGLSLQYFASFNESIWSKYTQKLC